MAPEQARDSRATSERSDIYSLGCTFYFLLTGGPPFAGGDIADKLSRHCTKPPPDPCEARPTTPKALGAVIRKMMAKRPENRFQNYGELLAALRAGPLAELGAGASYGARVGPGGLRGGDRPGPDRVGNHRGRRCGRRPGGATPGAGSPHGSATRPRRSRRGRRREPPAARRPGRATPHSGKAAGARAPTTMTRRTCVEEDGEDLGEEEYDDDEMVEDLARPGRRWTAARPGSQP